MMKTKLKYAGIALSLLLLFTACSKKDPKPSDDNPFLSGSSKIKADFILSDGKTVKFVGGFSLMGMFGNNMLQDDDNPDLYNVTLGFSDGDMVEEKDPKYGISINLFEITKEPGVYQFDPDDENMSQKPLLVLTDYKVNGNEDSVGIYYPIIADGDNGTIRQGKTTVEVTSFKGEKIKGKFSGTVYNLYGGNVDSIVIKNGKFETKLNDITR